MNLIEAQRITQEADTNLILNIIRHLEIEYTEVKINIPDYWALLYRDQPVVFTITDLRTEKVYRGTIPWKQAIIGMEDQVMVLN